MTLTRNQRKVLDQLNYLGEATYDQLMRRYHRLWGPDSQSSEGIARRCRELAEAGLVVDTGKRDGERIVWRSAE